MSSSNSRQDGDKSDAEDTFTLSSEDTMDHEWFCNNAVRLGEILRKLHNEEDYRRLDFVLALQEFLDEGDEEDVLHGLYEGGLPQVLMDIASDRSLYEEFLVDGDISDYIPGVHITLSSMIRHSLEAACSHSSHRAGSHHPWARYILRQYRHLWHVVADFPVFIKYDGWPPSGGDSDEDGEEYFGDDSSYREGLANLLMDHTMLSMQEDGQFPGLASSQGGYITMLCWIYCSDPVCRNDLTLAQTGYFAPASEPATKAFLDRVFARKTLTPQDYIDRCFDALWDDDVLDEYLWALLQAMSNMYKHPLFRVVRKKEGEPLRFLVMNAAKRQVCSGKEAEVHQVLVGAFNHIATSLAEDFDIPDAITALYKSRVLSRQLVPLSAKVLVTATRDDDIMNIKCILELFGLLAEELEETRNSDTDFRVEVKGLWHRTYDDLKKRPLNAPQRSRAIEIWRTFGGQCGVDVDAPYDAAAEPKEAKEQQLRAKSCAWSGCLCFVTGKKAGTDMPVGNRVYDDSEKN